VSPERRSEVNNLVDIFRARIVDVAADSVIVEITGTEDKIEGMVELLRPVGIVEMVRTGQIAMTRGAITGVRRSPGANGYDLQAEPVDVMAN
jgi:acetolactate synthase-1/3 small subunit